MQIKFRVALWGTVAMALCPPSMTALSGGRPPPGAWEDDLAGDRTPVHSVTLREDECFGRGKQTGRGSSARVSGKWRGAKFLGPPSGDGHSSEAGPGGPGLGSPSSCAASLPSVLR